MYSNSKNFFPFQKLCSSILQHFQIYSYQHYNRFLVSFPNLSPPLYAFVPTLHTMFCPLLYRVRREKVNVLSNKFVSNYVNFFFTHPVHHASFMFLWKKLIIHLRKIFRISKASHAFSIKKMFSIKAIGGL